MTPTGASHSVLVLRLSALGDILHALPAVAGLRKAWPRARIGWVVERRAAVLLAGNPVVDELYVIDTRAARRRGSMRPATQEILRLVGRIRAARYELALDFQGLFKSAVLAWMSGAPKRIGFSGSGRRERLSSLLLTERIGLPRSGTHVIRINNDLLRPCGVTVPEPWEFPLPPVDSERRRVEERLRHWGLSEFVLLNLGGGWVTKTWKAGRYAELSMRINDELGLPCLFTWGPGEEPLIQEVRERRSGRAVPEFPTSFLELIPLISRCRLFIGGDTGPMQLAAALGKPIVAIFGPTTPSRNGPFSPADATVHHPRHCSNCYFRTCPYQMECMDIGVDEVFEAVVRRLHGEPRG